MQVGQKIRKLRLKKNMTQSQLVGDELTRNMLSRIENGTVRPSMQTLAYLAQRLQVPLGMLVSGEQDEYLYERNQEMTVIKQLFRASDYRKCLVACAELGPNAENDDEISLILAECNFQLGRECFLNGQLLQACSFFNEARRHADKTPFESAWLFDQIKQYYHIMHTLSDTVQDTYSPDMKSVETRAYRIKKGSHPFLSFMEVQNALEMNNMDVVSDYLSLHENDDDDAYVCLMRAELSVYDRDYAAAKVMLEELEEGMVAPKPILLYYLYLNLEICCRETEDYKGAYLASQKRGKLLESFQQK